MNNEYGRIGKEWKLAVFKIKFQIIIILLIITIKITTKIKEIIIIIWYNQVCMCHNESRKTY